MGKKALRNCQHNMVKKWRNINAVASSIPAKFDRFDEIQRQHKDIVAIIVKYEADYFNGIINKHEYAQLKKQFEIEFSKEIKFLKVMQRRVFSEIFHQVLIIGAKYKCYICGCDLNIEHEYNKDHVFPDSRGFSLSGNMMPVHRICNLKKNNRLPTSRELKMAIEAYEFAGLEFSPRHKHNKNNVVFDYNIVLAEEQC